MTEQDIEHAIHQLLIAHANDKLDLFQATENIKELFKETVYKVSFKAGRRVGRKEVVEWIEEVSSQDSFTAPDGRVYGMRTIIEEKWQAIKDKTRGG